MKVLITLLILLLTHSFVHGQLDQSAIEQKRTEHIQHLSDTTSGVLNQEEIEALGHVTYFPFDTTYQLQAKFTKSKGKKFEMPTSTDRKPIYRRYGYLDFELHGVMLRLEVYQNIQLSKDKEHKNYLFIPFRDKTSGAETYGGGRYIDIEIPTSKIVLLDFNIAYNPYCAYSYRYSCPVPPAVNTLPVEIRAGEKTPVGH